MSHDLLFHGGVAGRKVGDLLLPGMAEHRYVPGCKHCEDQRNGILTNIDPPTPPDWVYACADKPYARWYASRAVHGSLYRVRLEGEVERSAEDPPWSWTYRGRAARVIAVLERNILLTHDERWRLFRRFGGTRSQFHAMLRAAAAAAADREALVP